MTTFGPLDEATTLDDSEYGGGPGLVQFPPGGKELGGGEKLGVAYRASHRVSTDPGSMWKQSVDAAGAVTREINEDDPIDPVTGLAASVAFKDGPVEEPK